MLGRRNLARSGLILLAALQIDVSAAQELRLPLQLSPPPATAPKNVSAPELPLQVSPPPATAPENVTRPELPLQVSPAPAPTPSLENVTGPSRPLTGLADLKLLTSDQLMHLFACAEPGLQPAGFVRGEVLYLTERLPNMKIRMSRRIWKGKVFSEEGDFINQWTLFRAIHSHAYVGPSFFDGKPCMILEYPERLPYFGNMRDEVREIAPGLYLSMVFERSAPYTFRGIIGMELEPMDSHRHVRRRHASP